MFDEHEETGRQTHSGHRCRPEIATLLLITPAWAQQTPIKWKAQTLWAATETPHKVFEELCVKIKTMTQGRLEIQAFPAGAIVPTNEALDALKNKSPQTKKVIEAQEEFLRKLGKID